LIPANNLCEVAYRDLVNDPVKELQRVYSTLGLPDFNEARPKVDHYVGGLKSYTRNSYPDLSRVSRNRLRKAWAGAYENWGYDPVEKCHSAG